MPRKRIADPDPAHSPEAAATASAKAPAGKASSAKKARAPRASANAVTHRHKKTQTIDAPVNPPATHDPVPGDSAETVLVATSQPMAAVAVAVEPQGTTVPAPTHEEIAFRAFFLAQARGFSSGTPEGDWLEAERQLNAERGIL
jgi:hypothetical protein